MASIGPDGLGIGKGPGLSEGDEAQDDQSLIYRWPIRIKTEPRSH